MSASYGSYDFGAIIGNFDTNFGQGAGQLRRLPGMDGGWDDLLDEPAETPPGRVTFDFYLVAENRADMDALRDEAKALTSYGLQRLEYTSLDADIATRYCYARCVDVRAAENKGKHTDLHQPVTVTFEVPDARWYKDRYASFKFGDGTTFGDGALVGQGALRVECSGTSTQFSLVTDGNARTLVKVAITAGVGQSCENPKVRRIAAGVVVDEIAYTGVLSAGDELFFDGRRHYAALNAVSVWDDLRYTHPALCRLEPGANEVRVLFANSGDAAAARFWYRDVYR